ncbi:hypothetical protein ACILPE_05745 [Capnocytophaga canimorsus]|uniref:hypothetical protein n=1 Tax=Capnocytophaga canimorsus TaxID=28188 RepID=UPI0037D8DA5A
MGKKYYLRRRIIYIHLFISFLTVLGESFSGFKNTLMAYHSLNFQKNFVRKKFYYIENKSYSTKSTAYYLYGIIEDDLPNDFEVTNDFFSPDNYDLRKKLVEKYEGILKIFVAGDRYGQFFEEDEQGRTYINVWYNPKVKEVYSINHTGIDYNGLLWHLVFTIWIIPEIWYLVILRRREQREKLLEKSNNDGDLKS